MLERTGIAYRMTIASVLAIFLTAVPGLANGEVLPQRCNGVPLETAADILGVPVGDLVAGSSDQQVSPEDQKNNVYLAVPYRCTIRSKTNFLHSMTYIVYPYRDPAKARNEYRQMKRGYEAVSKVDEVSGLGDLAFHAADPRFGRLVVIQGAVVVDVLAPKAFDQQKQIARLVMRRF